MPTKTIEIQPTSVTWQELLALVENGTEIILTQNQLPVARLTPISGPTARVAGLHPGAIAMADDFDESLPDTLITSKFEESASSDAAPFGI